MGNKTHSGFIEVGNQMLHVVMINSYFDDEIVDQKIIKGIYVDSYTRLHGV